MSVIKTDILKNLSLDMHQGINTVTEKVEYLDSGVPILQSKHITAGFLNIDETKYLSEEAYLKYKDKYQPKVNDILVCNIGTIGSSLRISKEENFLIAWNLFLIKLDENKLNSQYFAHYLTYLKDTNYFDKFLTGGTVKFINKKTMENIPVPLMPLTDQKHIAEILNAADALRRKDQALLKKYDDLAQAIFMDMFGDPVKNEMGWEVRKLGEIGEINSGSTPSRDKLTYFEGDIPWVKTTEVKGEIIKETEEKISEEALKNSSCKLNPKNSIVIAMYGQGKTRGNVGILDIEATTNQACGILRPNECYNSFFVFFLLKSMYHELRQLGRGGNQENLNLNIVKNFSIYFPPKPLQDEFEKKILKFELIKKTLTINHSKFLFQSLLQQAFKGELV